MADKKYVGSIEAGGTKFILAVQDVETGETVATDRIPTTAADETLKRVRNSLKASSRCFRNWNIWANRY